MTIVSHSRRFVFLKTRKTAGTSIEKWLAPLLVRGDIIATATENLPVPVGFWDTPNQVSRLPGAEKILKRICRYALKYPPGVRFREHMAARDVRDVIGADAWDGYHRVCVERDPWDRMISFWKWRQVREDRKVSLDAFLEQIATAPGDRLVRGFSNIDIYTIDGRIAVDQVIPYRALHAGLEEFCKGCALPLSPASLPFQKAGHRSPGDSVRSLRPDQVEAISRICRREIDLLGWDFGREYG
ncbi:MAG: hypothetical protein WCD16_04805 [Paracoccaceae bacterium]